MKPTAGRVQIVASGADSDFVEVRNPNSLYASERRILEILRNEDKRFKRCTIPNKISERLISDRSRLLAFDEAGHPGYFRRIKITENRFVTKAGARFSALGFAQGKTFTELEVLAWFEDDALPASFKSLDPASICLEPRSEYPGRVR